MLVGTEEESVSQLLGDIDLPSAGESMVFFTKRKRQRRIGQTCYKICPSVQGGNDFLRVFVDGLLKGLD